MNVGTLANHLDIKMCALLILGSILASCVLPDEPKEQQRIYCENVKAGHWPDYEKSYKRECGGKDPPKFNENITK